MFNVKRNFKIRDDDTVYDMMRMYNNLSSQFEPLHAEMTKNYDFTVGELQWEKEVKEKLKEERRPANSYNLIRTILNVIIAIELQNRKQMIAKPKGEGDNELAQVVTEVMLHYLRNTNFDYHRTKVFLDSIVAKFGVYHVGWKYDNDPLGELFVESIDPREIMFEPNYADPLWSKASYLFRKHSMTIEEILNIYALNDTELQDEILKEASAFFEKDEDKKKKWISKKLKALFSAVYETATGFSTTNDNLFKNYLQWWDPATGKFDILELHEQRTERRLIIYDTQTERTYDITEITKEENGFKFDNEKIQLIKEQYQINGEPRIELENRRYLTTVIPTFNIKVNEQPYPFNSKYYVYIPQYCYDYHSDPLKAQSIIDDLKDPQAHFNKAQSLKLELLARYVNKGWIVDENAIDGFEEDWTSERIAPYRRVRAGYLNAIKPEEGQTISPDLIRDPIETQQLMKVISNADDEIRGQKSSDVKSGRHFIAKEQQQTRSFSYIFNNVDNSAKAVCELAVNFIQHYVTTQRIYRITSGKEPYEIIVNQSQYEYDANEGKIIEKVKNDLTIGEYDIEISNTPYSSNAKEIEYAKLIDLFEATININPKKAELLLEEIVEMGGFPNAQKIIGKWKKLEEPNLGQMQLVQIMQQLQMIAAKLGIEEKKEDLKTKKLINLEKAQNIKNTAKGFNPLGNFNKSTPIGMISQNN